MRTYSYNIDTRYNELYSAADLIKANERIDYIKKQLEKDIKDLEKQQVKIYERFQEVLQFNHVFSVYIYRRKEYTSKHIYYEVTTFKIPEQFKDATNAGWSYGEQIYYQKYTGQERREALKDAEDQAKQYRVELKKLGFN